MTKEDILRLRDTAEQTRVQFKERVTRDNKYDVSCEMVAQSNSRGGMIVVGIDDKTGRINPLSFVEVQETTIGRCRATDSTRHRECSYGGRCHCGGNHQTRQEQALPTTIFSLWTQRHLYPKKSMNKNRRRKRNKTKDRK